MADQGEFSGITLSIFMDFFNGFLGEPVFITAAYHGQPVLNKTFGVTKVQGADFKIK